MAQKRKSKKRRTTVKKAKVYIPAHKIVIVCASVIAFCLFLLLISTFISQQTSKTLCEMLEDVVKNGSGKQAYIDGYRVGGKTGTAQKFVNGQIAQGKYVSSFVGFFPANQPKYSCVVIVDEPTGQHYGSTVAAPWAKIIFQQIINYKNIKPSE